MEGEEGHHIEQALVWVDANLRLKHLCDEQEIAGTKKEKNSRKSNEGQLE